METLAKRLEFARKERRMTQEQVADLAGLQQSDISKMERGDTQRSAHLLSIAKALRANPHWLDSGDGEWQELAVSPGAFQQAHTLSHLEPIVDPQAVKWEWILTVVKEELPWRFVVPMPDASLAGEVERGAELVFQVGYAPRVGKPVLVEHRSTGRRYIRLYAEAPEGWRAIATTEAFLSFDSSLHEVDILATVRWSE